MNETVQIGVSTMKSLLIALLLTSAAAAPVAAQSVNVGGLFPVLTYPEPTPEPVTQDETDIND